MVYDYANDWMIPEVGEEFEVWDKRTGKSIKVRCEQWKGETNEDGYGSCEHCCFWLCKCKMSAGNGTNLLCAYDDRHDFRNVYFVKVDTTTETHTDNNQTQSSD